MRAIHVKGMTCQHCVTAVTNALESIEAIQNVTVDLETGGVTFEETTPVPIETIKQHIEDAGYELD